MLCTFTGGGPLDGKTEERDDRENVVYLIECGRDHVHVYERDFADPGKFTLTEAITAAEYRERTKYLGWVK